jgi:cytochrome c oxidase subunit II
LRALPAVSSLAQALVETGHEYHHLFNIYVPIAVGVFVLIVVIVAVVVAIFARRRPEEAARWHEHNPLEGAYAVVLALTVVFLLYLTLTAEHRVDTVANHERPSVIVEATGAKWEWTFAYPAYGITARSGTVGRQPLVVPTGRAVRFELRSLDVIHAFWVPEVSYKHDAIPGSTQEFTLTFPHPGLFQGACAEFCGLRHSNMLFNVRAVSPAQFGAWARNGGKARTW